ncbi:hypothetical protein HanPSC8_Chr01g0017681 [Helianthus annuus]|nr:hypothetical protein HanPSC8_Chr03g0116561 [Helianthus annuus]KAJ0956644.1 hypothetical protein HanPSC8_Chr01g0017681 [Helianthus annuus]
MDILLSLRNTSNRVDTGALPPFQFSYLRNRKSLSEFWRDCPIVSIYFSLFNDLFILC